MQNNASLQLQFGYKFDDLYNPTKLEKLSHHFADYIKTTDLTLHEILRKHQHTCEKLTPNAESDFLTRFSPHLEDFISYFFGIEKRSQDLQKSHHALAPLYTCRRLFIQRRAAHYVFDQEIHSLNINALRTAIQPSSDTGFNELSFATQILTWLEDETTNSSMINDALLYCAWALTPEGQNYHKDTILFHLPQKLDFDHLIKETKNTNLRDGFDCTDPGLTRAQAQAEAHYCIHCHKQEKDSCSKGLKDQSHDTFKKNALGNTLTGCPLDQKISEMALLKKDGLSIGSLAIAMVDNPMIPATGHRICNDCMKSCIFQKQDPVNVPGLETQILDDVLTLPYGVEIYSLLTRWNPLKLRSPYPNRPTGYNVLVVGLGPAGFSLAHELLQSGHSVTGIDGTKIEPLPNYLLKQPIKSFNDIKEPLDTRQVSGFGGVTEYGVTVRWDKNYLKLIHLTLARHPQLNIIDGLRLGGTLTIDQAFAMGFDHIALCTGAGKPNIIPLKNGFAKGVRQGVDFLMALQLASASQAKSVANMQIRLPAVVIGSGLTAIDTATEALAYYPRQVAKFLHRYEVLCGIYGVATVRDNWSDEDTIIAEEFLDHAQQLQVCAPNQRLALLKQWGGVTIAYRKSMQESPAYKSNHLELQSALDEGVFYKENLTPLSIEVDEFNWVKSINTNQGSLPSKSIFFAAGINPNIVPADEYPNLLTLDETFMQPINLENKDIAPSALKTPETSVLCAQHNSGRYLSYFGDAHPIYTGSVVKALASAKRGAPQINAALAKHPPVTSKKAIKHLRSSAISSVIAIKHLSTGILEIVINSPIHAQNFELGYIYKLQFYKDLHTNIEGIALSGIEADKANGTITFRITPHCGSRLFLKELQLGDKVFLMGPTGDLLPNHEGKDILLMCEGARIPLLMAYAKKLSIKNKVSCIFSEHHLSKQEKKHCEKIPNVTIYWSSPESTLTSTLSKQRNGLFLSLTHIHALCGPEELTHLKAYIKAERGTFFSPDLAVHTGIPSPMQCMMKGICGQCIQEHKVDGKTRFIFSCANQSQDLETSQLDMLKQRLNQNSLQEKLTSLWINHQLKEAC